MRLTELRAFLAALDGASAEWVDFQGGMKSLVVVLSSGEDDDERTFELRCSECQYIAGPVRWWGAKLRASEFGEEIAIEDEAAGFRVVCHRAWARET